MRQLDLFTNPAIIPQSAPTILEFKDKNSYATVEIVPLGDGTWGRATHDNYHGYCGHGTPVYGEYATFDEALTVALAVIDRHAANIQIDRSSCCGDSHRRFARKVREWVLSIEDEYRIVRRAV